MHCSICEYHYLLIHYIYNIGLLLNSLSYISISKWIKQTQWRIREPPSYSLPPCRSHGFVPNLIFFLVSTFPSTKDHKYTSTISEVICLFTWVICTIQVIRSYASFKSLDHMHHSIHQIICIIQVWLNTPTINRVKTYTSLQHDIRSYVLVHYSTKKYDLAQFLTRSCASKSYVKYISTTLIYFSTSSNYMH